MKQEAVDKILTAIRRVLAGSIYVSDVQAARMLQQQVRGQNTIQESPVKSLSDRELEVFQLIGQWKKTKDIAAQLHLSIKTIEYYREQIKKKLNLKSAAELTHYATSWVQREATR
jgi:DNA-binding NarL/FixJ family response regulator